MRLLVESSCACVIDLFVSNETRKFLACNTGNVWWWWLTRIQTQTSKGLWPSDYVHGTHKCKPPPQTVDYCMAKEKWISKSEMILPKNNRSSWQMKTSFTITSRTVVLRLYNFTTRSHPAFITGWISLVDAGRSWVLLVAARLAGSAYSPGLCEGSTSSGAWLRDFPGSAYSPGLCEGSKNHCIIWSLTDRLCKKITSQILQEIENKVKGQKGELIRKSIEALRK